MLGYVDLLELKMITQKTRINFNEIHLKFFFFFFKFLLGVAQTPLQVNLRRRRSCSAAA